MGRDEERTLAQLKTFRKTLLDPTIAAHRGRIVKTTGDGLLVEFASAVDAMRCAVEVQRCMAGQNTEVSPELRIEFRVGIHVGDIIIDDSDIFGDGVNIAARLEGIAQPGGICISDDAHRQIRGKVDTTFDDMGLQTLKNIAEPMRVWRVRLGDGVSPAVEATLPLNQPLALPDKPSIAVLPFQNMSGDPEQDYFADGVVEEIITALSRIRWLFVIARNSSFVYKGRAVDVRQVGRELGVRYVLEGSVRKAANQVRITAQLIDAANGAHLWAQRFDGSLDDIFDLQDKVTAGVAGPIAPRLESAEIERARRKPTESLDAYDYYLRGVADVEGRTREANEAALQLFYKAIEIDRDFASAYAMAARCYTLRKANGWMIDEARETAETLRLARRAIDVGRDDAVALCRAGFALARVGYELENGAATVERAIALNPHLATAWQFSGILKAYLGEPETAIEHSALAMRLSPLDPGLYSMQTTTALAHFIAGRYDEASSWAEKAIRQGTNFLPAFRIAAASGALAGHPEEARNAVARMLQIDPTSRISNLEAHAPIHRPDDIARYKEGLRRAGLPE
jgi:TolB-like protein